MMPQGVVAEIEFVFATDIDKLWTALPAQLAAHCHGCVNDRQCLVEKQAIVGAMREGKHHRAVVRIFRVAAFTQGDDATTWNQDHIHYNFLWTMNL